MDIDFESLWRIAYTIGLIFCFLAGFFYKAVPKKIPSHWLLLPLFPLGWYAVASASKDSFLTFREKFDVAVRTEVTGIVAMIVALVLGMVLRSLIERARRPNGNGVVIDRSYALMRTASPKGSRVDRRA